MAKKILELDEHFPPNLSSSGEEILNYLKLIPDSIIIFDEVGRLVMLNEIARVELNLSSERLIGQSIDQLLMMKEFTFKHLLNQIATSFNLALKGIPQQFYWIKEQGKRPTQAFNILLNCSLIDGKKVIIVRLINILQAKTLEWVLLSLAEIANHGGINDLIDDITKLASEVFDAEHALVNLIDKESIAHIVSYFYRGKKQKNTTYSLINAPCEHVKRDKTIHYYNGDVQHKYPKDELLRELKVHSYLGGPLLSSEGDVVGLLIVMSEKNIEVNELNKTLFRLFIDRISLEIERLRGLRNLQFLASIPQQNPNPIIRLEASGILLYANNAGQNILKCWQKKNTIILPANITRAYTKAKESEEIIREETEVNGKIYLFTYVYIANFNQINIYATDITELKSAQKKMHSLAHYDAVTNLANRQYFEETLTHWITQAKQNNKKLALLLIDIDNFKSVNDSLGHHIGDSLLKLFSKQMTDCLRREDFIARLGGDEFVVLLKINNYTDAHKVAKKINQALCQPINLDGAPFATSCSIGLSFYPQSGHTIEDLLKHADIAMYQAKKEGKNRYVVFSKH